VALAAIDVEDVAVDERSFVQRDEDDRVGKFLREAEAAHRNRRHQSRLFLRGAGKTGQHAGVRGAGGHGIHANPRFGDLERHRLGEAFDSVLAADVDGGARRTLVPVSRGYVDNATAALSLHDAHFVLHAQDHASVLRDQLLNIEIRVSSDHSTTLADDLERGKLDIAFLRRELKPDLEYKLVAKEPLVVFLPSDHPLAARKAIDPRDLVGETFIGISEIPRVLRTVVSDYLKRTGIELTPHLEIDNFAMAISLVASTHGVALLPASAENFLTWSVVSRPLKGDTPTIDLVVGYHKANTSPILRAFLSKVNDLTTGIFVKARDLRT
jgi:DNA-binding transcriptional LysR family regulator